MVTSLHSFLSTRPRPQVLTAPTWDFRPLTTGRFPAQRIQPSLPGHMRGAPHSQRREVKAQAFNLLEFFIGPKVQLDKSEASITTFDDVAGIDEAKQDLEEVVDFLKNPDKYTRLGATIPRGVLLSGPPGTGKTLLAKATAGEAGVPFFSASGSEFVEMFVGMGAARVRRLFDKAQKSAPCIIFIDEIDAMGKSRSGPRGIGGGSDEREQTLNQLLTEMDGFQGNNGIVVIAATNRADVLDSALKRPGRFDRQITIGLPDRIGREQILNVHSKNKRLGKDVFLNIIAQRTPGFSGADLANLMNEAAINAVRRGSSHILYQDIDNAVDTAITGSRKMQGHTNEAKRQLVAVHEAGHALVSAMVGDYDKVQKITIEPRGQAAGFTWHTPDEDRIDSGLYSTRYLKNMIAVALGGRVAEEVVFGHDKVTTGAANDMQKVASIAKQMVTKFGMSELGPYEIDTAFGKISSSTAEKVDMAIQKLVMEGYNTAKRIITKHRDILDAVSNELLDHESLSGAQFEAIINAHQPSAETQ